MRRPFKDVVVLLPGITGSVLQKDGKDVWAFTGGAALRALFSLGGSIKELALDGDDPELDDHGDGVTATRVMPDIHLIPGLWRIDGYGKIGETIREHFDVEPGVNSFEFAYDWRRDNRVAARLLARRCHNWLRSWRERSGARDAQLVLVGHSMGGLVARHFLEVLDGWRDTRALVTFGTPYRGSLNALDAIVHGARKAIGPVTLIDVSSLLRSLTSVYQLLPIYPCVADPDGVLRRVAETTALPNLDPARAAAALAFHREIEDAAEAHRRDQAYLDRGYEIHPVVGTFQRTLQSARRVEGGIEMLAEYEGQDQDGDGTVPRVSATPIELSDEAREMYASERHATLQNQDQVLVQLIGVLSRGELDLGRFKGLLGPRVSLDLDDVFAADEPVTMQVRCEDAAAPLSAVVTDEDGEEVSRSTPIEAPDWTRIELPPVPVGTYRVRVSGGAAEPVSDVFLSLDSDAG
jgi:pimeloyl-ACP methyl ester carboxylesterase